MKTTGESRLLCNIQFYNAMIKALENREDSFEYNEITWSCDNALDDFIRDLKRGNLKLTVKEN